jgi:hypothetical protein
MRHVAARFVPRLDGRWAIALVAAGLVVAAATFVRWGDPVVEMELLALGPDGQFHDQLDVPADWADTATTTTDAVVRFPLILGVHNIGHTAGRPERVILRIPARFRLAGPGGEELPARIDAATPLVSYRLQPRLGPVEPGRLPTLLPGLETLWIEAIVPRYYCVGLGEGVPEFVPAPAPALGAMSQVRIFYALEGSDLRERQTGVLELRLDTARMAVPMPEQPPTFAVETDAAAARPEMAPLRLVGSRQVQCGEPEAPMEMLSTVWETEGGARLITLDHAGTVRKHLYDLDGDGIIDRESWDPEGNGRFTATRRARLPIPEFLLPPPTGAAYDMGRFADIPPDSLARLDPYARAMRGPGPVPIVTGPDPLPERVDPPRPAAPAPLGAPAAAPPAPATAEPAPPAQPTPPVRRGAPLGRPVDDPPD